MPIFLILSILTDHNLFGSDVEQDCSYTVFAEVFFTLTKHSQKWFILSCGSLVCFSTYHVFF